MNRTKLLRSLILLLLAVSILLSFCACGAKKDQPEEPAETEPAEVIPEPEPEPEPQPEPKPDSEPEPEPEPEPEELPYDGPVNPLTGMPVDKDISMNRPYAIMINNISFAQPQLGISKADIIYETLAEGGITRMLAVFSDVENVGTIGSIRSSRHYYLDLVQGLDALYIHAGGSEMAYDAMAYRGVAHVDGVNGSRQDIFYRDSDRMYSLGYEHSLVTTGELINEYVPTYGFRMEHEDDFDYGMTFEDNVDLKDGEKADDVYVCFSGFGKSTSFEYDEKSGLYYASQYGEGYYDGNDWTQVSAANIIIIYADMYVVDSEGRLDVDLTSGGSGYFVTGGKYKEISWSKESVYDRFVFTYDDGSEITYNRGTTYVCIISYSGYTDIS